MPTYSYITFTNDSITVPLMHLTGLLVDGGTAGCQHLKQHFLWDLESQSTTQ